MTTASALSLYEQGRQPCERFVAQREGNGYGVWDNVHECFGPYQIVSGPTGRTTCTGSVSFCDSCSTDHHSLGWDACGDRP